MPKRIDLAADRFLYVSLYKMQTSKGLIAVLHFYSPVYFYNTCIKFYITGLHLEICLNFLTTRLQFLFMTKCQFRISKIKCIDLEIFINTTIYNTFLFE